MALRKTKVKEFPDHDFTPEQLKEHFISCLPTSEIKYTQKRPWASQAGFCERMVALNGLLPERELERNTNLNYYGAIGSAIEARVVQDYFYKGSLVIADYYLPKQLFGGFDIGGKIDCILNINDKLVLVDIKTVAYVEQLKKVALSAHDIHNLAKNGVLIIEKGDERIKSLSAKRMYLSYYRQVQTYAAILGINNSYIQVFSRGVKDNWEWGGKNHPTTDFFPIPVDDESLIKSIAILYYGLICRDQGVIPDKNSELAKGDCNNAFCEFQELCWGESFHPFHDVTPAQTKEWKTLAYGMAQDYIADRPSRHKEFVSILKKDSQHFDLNSYLSKVFT